MKVLILNGKQYIKKIYVKKLAEGIHYIYIKIPSGFLAANTPAVKYIEKGPDSTIVRIFDQVTIATPAKLLAITTTGIAGEVELMAVDRKLLHKLYKEAKEARGEGSGTENS